MRASFAAAFALTIMALVAATASALAVSVQGAGTMIATFGPNLPAVVCAPYFVCDIRLQSGERIVHVALGDTARWLTDVTSTTEPHVMLKPTEDGLLTNLVVLTDRRTYNLVMVSSVVNSVREISFVYPPTASASPRPLVPAADPTALDFAWTVRASSRVDFLPTRVFSDLDHVYIELPEHLTNLPVLVALDTNGEQQRVNYRVRNHYMIVDGVPDALALLDGTGADIRVTISRGVSK